MAQAKRTAASRRRNTAWNRFWIFPGAAALAIAALYLGDSDAETVAKPANVGRACLVLVAGGLLAGVLAAQDKSSPRLLPALLAPIPILAFAGLLMVGLSDSESNTDLLVLGLVLGITYLLYEIPLAIAFRITFDRRDETPMRLASDPEASARKRELDLATDHGRATTVVREYPVDDEGRGHLEADTKALEARGYDRVSVEHLGPGAAEVGFAVVMSLAGAAGSTQDDKVVATFRRE